MESEKEKRPIRKKTITDSGAQLLMESILKSMVSDFNLAKTKEKHEGTGKARLAELRKAVFVDNGAWFTGKPPKEIWDMLNKQYETSLPGSGRAMAYLKEVLILLAYVGHLNFPGENVRRKVEKKDIGLTFGLSDEAVDFLVSGGYIRISDDDMIDKKLARRLSNYCRRAETTANLVKNKLRLE